MPGTHKWRETAAGLAFAALVAGTSAAQELPSPSYGFSPVPAVAPAACQQPNDTCYATYSGGSFWDRYHQRKWEKKRRKQDAFLGYPEEFCEQPLGMALYSQLNTQIANGIAAKQVLYHFDFVDGGSQLNWKGRQQLAKHAATMNGNAYPLVIEQSIDQPELDEARRLAVQQSVTLSQYPISVDRIVVGIPTAVALTGQQAAGLNANLQRDTRAGGVSNLAPGSFRAGGAIGGISGDSSGGATTP